MITIITLGLECKNWTVGRQLEGRKEKVLGMKRIKVY
jgi:hypothetical protein